MISGKRVTRTTAVFLTLVMLSFGMGFPGWAANGTFKDVGPSFWGYDTIEWGAQNRIVSGFADGSFRPNDIVTEEQFLAMWLRAFGYRDANDGGGRWSDPYYLAAAELALPVTGKRNAAIMRLGVAEIIAAFHGHHARGNDAVRFLLDQGWSKGKTAPTVEGFGGQDPLKRAEAVQFIFNVIHSRQSAESPQPTPENPRTTEPQVPANADQLTEDEQRMLQLVNEERVRQGLSPLQVDMELTRLARLKSQDMVDNQYFSHDSPTYGSPFEMMEQYGIEYRAAGENLAGNRSVEAAHEALMNSEGHRANILNASFTHIGIGIVEGSPYGKIFTQMFIGK